MTIQAIQTKYKGYRFRSRLEARWAVFFDALGVRWEYEKEGYKLSDGSYYLPDFYLPDNQLWFEVKNENVTEADLKKFYKFTDSGASAILAKGMPSENMMELHCWDVSENSGGQSTWNVDVFTVNENKIVFFVLGSPEWYFEKTLGTDDILENKIEVVFGLKRQCLPIVTKAIEAARSARFEHGE